MNKQSRVKGIAISYLSAAVRSVSKLVMTPLYLKILGMDDYGFYQYVFSVACYAIILDFGISSVVNMFSIRHREKGDQEGVENVMFYALMFCIGSALLIALGCAVITIWAPEVFGDAVAGRIPLTRQLLVLIMGELILLMFQHYFEGVILAAEKYVTHRIVALIQILLRCILTLLMLFSSVGVLSIALGDLFGVGLCLGFEIWYCKARLGLVVRFHYRDPELFRAIAKLSLALCLQSVVAYLNSSIDKYVLGRYIDTVVVTVYTVAVELFAFFNEIPTTIQRLYLPQAVKLVAAGADGEELTDFVIRPGRYQFLLVAGVLGGFILFGQEFILMWTGKSTLDAWKIALVLMVPAVLPLIQNVCLSLLTAMNKRMFRSYVLCGIAVANLFLTIFLVKRIGLMGAPVGTCVTQILGETFIMNWYYKTRLGINVKRLFASIFRGILPCAAVTTGVCFLLRFLPVSGLIWFLVKCAVFCIIYAALLWFWGINTEEKVRIGAVFGKIAKKVGLSH